MPTTSDPPRRQRRKRRLALVAGGVGLAAGAAVFTVVVTGQADDRDARREVEYREAVVRKRAQLVRVQAPHRGSAPELAVGASATATDILAAREALYKRVEETITKDARARAEAR